MIIQLEGLSCYPLCEGFRNHRRCAVGRINRRG